MSRTFVIGDIHGAYQALLQCLARCSFDYQQDKLIALGDVCDGWPDTSQCIEELLKIRRLVYLLGNHDLWALGWARNALTPEIWITQGGQATLGSYPQGMPRSHQKLLGQAYRYYIVNDRLFVHAGIQLDLPLELQGSDTFLWDRSLCLLALRLMQQGNEQPLGDYREIYIGHTPTVRWGSDKPIHACNVWMMDTGAGWDGPLTIMDIDSKEVYQSDPVPLLYPGIKGR